MAGTNFGGATIYRPGAFSVVSKDQQTVINPGSTRVIMVVGPLDTTAVGKGSGVLKFYNDPSVAASDLKIGDTLTAMQLAWSARNSQDGPSADVVGVCEVVGTGVSGAVQTADWQTALDKLATKTVDGVVVVSGDPAIHALVKTHVTAASGVTQRKERRAFVGSKAGDTVATSVTNATALLEARVCYIHGGVKRYINGAVVTLPGYLTAALVAGLWAGSDPAEPITYDKINAIGLDTELSSADIDTLLQAGVICFEPASDGGFHLIQSLTTALTELSSETVIDTLTVEIRHLLEKNYVGTRGGKDAAIYADVLSILEDAKTRRRWLADDTDGTNVISPAYSNPIVSQTGKNVNVTFFGNVVDPINQILINAKFQI
jgi:hypothetical protein